MPYWAKRDDYAWEWKYLASVAVGEKVYICSKGLIRLRSHARAFTLIAIHLLDQSMGRPEPLEQSCTMIRSDTSVIGCSAVSQEDEIYLLFDINDLGQEEYGFMLLTYHTVAMSWSELAISGPNSPSRHVKSISCRLDNEIFVYQSDVGQVPPVRAVYALNVRTMEWSLRRASSWQSNEYSVCQVFPWKNYVIGLGRHFYSQSAGQFSAVPAKLWIVSMFDTATNTWIVPQTTGEPPRGTDVHRLAVYSNKLLVIMHTRNGRSDAAFATLYCFDLNNYAWSKVHYLGTPAMEKIIRISCFCLDNLIYCFELVGTQPYRTLVDVIKMTTKSLTKQCLEQNSRRRFLGRLQKAGEILQTIR